MWESARELELTAGVSCPKFDLCRSCYQKVEEIHPAHAFLSLPDQELPPVGSSGAQTGRARDIVERRRERFLESGRDQTLTASNAASRRVLSQVCLGSFSFTASADSQLLAGHRRTALPLCRLPLLVS